MPMSAIFLFPDANWHETRALSPQAAPGFKSDLIYACKPSCSLDAASQKFAHSLPKFCKSVLESLP